jgi:hypothetical protein
MDDVRQELAELNRIQPDREVIRRKLQEGSRLPDPIEPRREPRIAVIAVAAVIAIAGMTLLFGAFRGQPGIAPPIPAAAESPSKPTPTDTSPSPTGAASGAPCLMTDSPALGDTATSFDTNCLTIVAHQPTTIDVKVADDGLQHSLLVCSDKDCNDASQIAATDRQTGPTLLTLDLPGLDPGTYFFEDPIHPVDGNGTLYVVDGS